MNNRELKDIIEQIEENEPMLLQEIAVKANINRSHLSTLMNTEEVKNVSDRLVAKVKKQFPAYFQGKPTNQQNQQSKSNIAYVERLIAEKEARRLDAMALADKMEAHYKDMVAALERAQNTINDGLKPIKEKTDIIETNSRSIQAHLRQIGNMTRADDLQTMDSLDRIEGREVGTSSTEASIVEHALGAPDEVIGTNPSNDKEGSLDKAKQKRKA